MTKTILAAMIGLSLAMTAYAANPSWLNVSASLTDQALSAKKNGVNPGAAALAIAAAGADAQFSVQATVVAYASCPALEESVREVVTNDPGSAYDVVAGIQNLESCPCSTDNMWPHARLKSRVRVHTPSRRFESVGLGVQSNCVAIAASEAVKAAPNQARAVFSAVAGDPLGGPGTDAQEQRKQAAVVADDLDVKNVNALVLRMPGARAHCENVPIALGMIATALGDGGEKWLDDTAIGYESEANLRQIDVVGAVGMPPQDWLGSKAGQPLTVVRQDSACNGGWSVQDGVSPTTATNKHCTQNARDLVLLEYQNDAERYRTVSVLNKTGAQINLDSSGYILEIYADGASTPARTIQLKGNLSNDQALVLVDEDAPADVKAQATLVTGELKVEKISALVLKRADVAGRTCEAAVVASARDIRLPLELTSVSSFAVTREPRSDDTLASSRRAGEVAGPN